MFRFRQTKLLLVKNLRPSDHLTLCIKGWKIVKILTREQNLFVIVIQSSRTMLLKGLSYLRLNDTEVMEPFFIDNPWLHHPISCAMQFQLLKLWHARKFDWIFHKKNLFQHRNLTEWLETWWASQRALDQTWEAGVTNTLVFRVKTVSYSTFVIIQG